MKAELRQKYKIKRKFLGSVQRQVADGAIADEFLNAFGGKDSFFIYNSFGTEADTHGIISALQSGGKRVYLPRVEGENIVPVPFGSTRRGAFGVEEPLGAAYSGDIEVTVVPLLAVNGKGYRLGYGGGYYDRYLKGARTLKVGLGYHFQLTEEFIADGWDEPLDLFVCERGIYDFRDRR